MVETLILLFAFIFSWLLSGYVRKLLLKVKALDLPNPRSSHFEPTPRGGGIGMIIVFFAAASCYLIVEPADISEFAPFLLCVYVGGGLIALLGFSDDMYSISPQIKFLCHLCLALPTVFLLDVPSLQLGIIVIDNSWLLAAVACVAVVWCINFFNFMDGIDGIATLQAMTMALSALIISLVLDGLRLHNFLFAALCVTGLGFWFWNRPPAKVFMGDVGSCFLGYLLAVFALESSANGVLNVWSWLILFGIFFVDATATLFLRLKSRSRIIRAHNDHAYQRLTTFLQRSAKNRLSREENRARAHVSVLFGTLLINVAWLFPLALVTALFPEWGAVLAVIAFAPLILLVIQVDSRHHADVCR